MEKVKVLLIGSAFSADLHMEAYQRNGDVSVVTAICDLQEERIHALARRYKLTGYEAYTDYKTAIDSADCDAVDICLPNFLHCEVALYAFEKGKHVICEKPLATTVADAKRMIEASDTAGKKLYYAEDWLFAPSVIRALEIVEEGAVGDAVLIRAREAHSGSHSPFAQTLKLCGGGCMIHLGIHPIGLAMGMKNNRWVSVTANASGGLEKNLVHKTMEGEDWATCTLLFEDGTSAIIEANYITIGGMEDMIDIYGTKGCIHVDMNFSSAVKCFSVPGLNYTIEKADITTGWSTPAVDEKYNLGYVGEIRHFMESIQNDSDARVGLRGVDGYENLKVIEAIYRSVKEGRAVFNSSGMEW